LKAVGKECIFQHDAARHKYRISERENMNLQDRVVANAAKQTGLTPDQMKSMSPEAIRKHLTAKTGKPFTISTSFPFIGRGNVLRDGILSSKEIDRDIDRILGL